MEYIFKEIVDIMHRDYAGFNDKFGWDNPKGYFKKIQRLKEKNQLTRDALVEIVNDYLIDFNDHHIYFNDNNAILNKSVDRGFRVRRYKESLYVTQVHKEKELKTGMTFISIGGYTIPELEEKHCRLLKENHPERENWMPIFSLYDFGEVRDSQGNLSEIKFKFYEKANYKPTYSVKKYNENTLLLTFTDFMNPDAIASLISENKELLGTTDNWIIDVRVNYGGSDSSFYPLLPYLMPEDGVELVDPEDKMFFNCTDSNAERALEETLTQLKNTHDEEAQQFVKVFIREWKRNKGKGFVEFNFEDIMPDTFVKGNKTPKSVVVLSDYMCGSSGESFVEVCKKSNKVIVIGRPTMGLNDYANVVSKKWDEGFEFSYPTSRLSRIDKGLGMTGKGVEPDLYVPWTPQQLAFDIDLEKALEVLSLEWVKGK